MDYLNSIGLILLDFHKTSVLLSHAKLNQASCHRNLFYLAAQCWNAYLEINREKPGL